MNTFHSHAFPALALVVMVGLVPSLPGGAVAKAQDGDRTNEARSLYDAGAVAFSDGRFEDALRRWRESYALSGLPPLLYNIGAAHDRLGQAAEAIEAYQRYLDAVPDAQNANYTRSRIGVLQQQLPSPSGEDPRESEAAVASASAAEGDSAAAVTVTTESAALAHAAAPEGRSLIGPVALLIGGGVALAAGVAVAFAADSQYADLEATCPGGLCPPGTQGDIDQLSTLGLTADMLMAGGGAVALGGLVWWLVGGGDEEEQPVQVHVSPQSLLLRGHF